MAAHLPGARSAQSSPKIQHLAHCDADPLHRYFVEARKWPFDQDAVVDRADLVDQQMGRAEEVADAILFLMKNEYMNGTTLVIDGAASLV